MSASAPVLVTWHTALTDGQRVRFIPLCPDFVVELRSPSDSLSSLHDKMGEYRDNGARLGWLIDPPGRQVFVYRPDSPPERLEAPATLRERGQRPAPRR